MYNDGLFSAMQNTYKRNQQQQSLALQRTLQQQQYGTPNPVASPTTSFSQPEEKPWWENVGNFVWDVAKSIPEVGGDIVTLLGDVPGTMAEGGNRIGKALDFNNRDLSWEDRSQLFSTGLAKVNPGTTLFADDLEKLTNWLGTQQPLQDLRKSLGFQEYRPVQDVLSKADRENLSYGTRFANYLEDNDVPIASVFTKDSGYKYDEGNLGKLFNVASTFIPVGKAAKLLPGGAKLLAGASDNVGTAFLKGLLEEGGEKGVKNIAANIGGRAISGAGQSGLQYSLDRFDKNEQFNIEDFKNSLLMGGAFGGGFGGAGYAARGIRGDVPQPRVLEGEIIPDSPRISEFVPVNQERANMNQFLGIEEPSMGIRQELPAGAIEPSLNPGSVMDSKNITAELKKMNRALFGDDNIQVSKNILSEDGQNALGKYQNNWIEILDGQANPRDTFYHESVHKAFDIVGDTKLRREILDQIGKDFNLPKDQFKVAEEILSENFIRYAKSREGFTGKIKLFFDQVLQKLKSWIGKADQVKGFYQNIASGKFRGKQNFNPRMDPAFRMDDDFELDFNTTPKQQPTLNEIEPVTLSKKAQGFVEKIKTSSSRLGEINNELNALTPARARTPLSERPSYWIKQNSSQFPSDSYARIQKLAKEKENILRGNKSYEMGIRKQIVESDPKLKEIYDEIQLLSKDPEYIRGVEELGYDARQYRAEKIQELNEAVDSLYAKSVDTTPVAKTPAQAMAPATRAIDEAITPQLRTESPAVPETPRVPNERKFATTLKDSLNTTPELKEKLSQKDFTYQKITNKETIESAQSQIDADEVAALQKVYSTQTPTAETNVIGQLLIQKYQQAGQFDKAAEVAQDLITKATAQGQAIQALSIWDRLSPDGVLLYTKKQMQKNKVKPEVLTKEKIKIIVEKAEAANLLPEGSVERQKAKVDLLQEVADVSQTRLQKIWKGINDFRYANILSSPNTHINNIFGNTLQSTLTAPVTRLASGAVDVIASALTGKERSVYVKEVPAYYKGLFNSLGEGFKRVGEVFKGDQLSSNLDMAQLPGKNPILYGKYSPFAAVSKALEASDVFFRTIIEGGEKEALATRYREQGIPFDEETISAMAKDTAEYFTFRRALDPSNQTGQGALLSQIDKITAGVNKMKQNPVVGWFVPFVQTPMNIFKQGIEYSPVGFANLIGADNKQEVIAKALVGSTVMAAAASLIMNSDSTWAAPTDAKEREAFYASGRQPYSIKVGDKWIAFDKLGPLSYPIAMAAAWKYNSSQTKKSYTNSQVDNFMGTIAEVGKFFSDQSYVKSIGDLVSLAQGDETAASRLGSNIPGQMVPLGSLVAWASRAVDPVRRDPQNAQEQLIARIPFASRSVTAMKDSLGNELVRPDNELNLFSPVKVSTAKEEGKGAQQYELDQLRILENRIKDVKNKADDGKIDEKTAREQVAKLEAAQQQKRDEFAAKFGLTPDQMNPANDSKDLSKFLGLTAPKKTSLGIFKKPKIKKAKKVKLKKIKVGKSRKPKKTKIKKIKIKKPKKPRQTA